MPSDHELRTGLGGWLHTLDGAVAAASSPDPALPKAGRLAPMDVRDAIYRFLLGEQPLLERHAKALKTRGLSREAIDRLGYCSWGSSKYTRSPLAQQAFERDPGAIDVPGVAIRDQGRGPYVTLTGAPGIALPIRNVDGQIQALQIALDDRTQSKYVFISSARYGGASPGTPVHIARSATPIDPGRVYLTEGILKADIAAQCLGQVVIGIPGVHALAALPDALLALQARDEIASLVVALDMDYKQNPAVAKARTLIAERAARLGIPVFLADWDEQMKGLDDLLVAGGRAKLTPYQVQGNGRRPLEPAPDAPPEEKTPKLSLAAARDSQQKAIDDYLDRDRQAERERGQTVGLFLAASPGTGKSHAITKAVKRHIRKRSRAQVGVFVGRHDQVKSEGREAWREIRGRTHEVLNQPTPCAFPGRQRQLVELRVSGQAGCNACPQHETCKANSGRESTADPFYLNQLRPDPIQRVSVYQAGHFLTSSVWAHVRAVILDDVDVRDLQLERVAVRRTDLEYALAWIEQHPDAPYAMAQPLLHLVSELTRQAPNGEFFLSGPDLIARLERLAAEHKITLPDALSQARQASEPDPFPEGYNLTSARLDVPRRFLSDLLSVLTHEHQESALSAAREIAGWNRRIEVSRELGEDVVLTLTLRRDLPIQALAGKDLIVSNASITLAELEVLFPHITRWIVVRPEVEMPESVKLIQYVDRGYGKRAMQGGRNRKGRKPSAGAEITQPEKNDGPDLQADALEEIREIRRRHAGQKIGLVSYKFFAERAKREFRDLVTSHFYGQRGSNKLATCDVLIVLGTPRPNPKAFLANAEALHWDESPINTQTVLETQRLGKFHTRTREYVDERLRQMARAKTTEEMLQAIGRIRPLSVLGYIDREQLDLDFGAEQIQQAQEQQRRAATVYVFSNLPLPGLDVEVRRSTPRVPRPELQSVQNNDTQLDEKTAIELPEIVDTPTAAPTSAAPSTPATSSTGRAKRPASHHPTPDLFAGTLLPIGLAIATMPSATGIASSPNATGPPAHAPPQPRAG